MTRVNTGVQFEYKIRDYFQARGYEVMRAAGSKGAIDLLIWNKHGEVFAIQAKKESRNTSYDEDIERLRAVPVPAGWNKELWVKQGSDILIYDLMGRAKMITISDVNSTIRSSKEQQ